jgi:hypothetical protein
LQKLFSEIIFAYFYCVKNHACSLGKISVFKDKALNDTIGDEVLGWFE